MNCFGFLGRTKGQFSIEYLISFILFASVLIYLSFQIAGTVPRFYADSQENRLSAKAVSVTDKLIRSRGNWTGQINYGLAKQPHLLDPSKVNRFNRSCNENYTDVRWALGLENTTDFRVRMTGTRTGKIYIDCTQKRRPSGVSVERIERYAVVNDEISRMVFQIW